MIYAGVWWSAGAVGVDVQVFLRLRFWRFEKNCVGGSVCLILSLFISICTFICDCICLLIYIIPINFIIHIFGSYIYVDM